MKKMILAAAACWLAVAGNSQQLKTSTEMVAIRPVVADALQLPADAKASLGMKMTQMVTQNGMGSQSGQFALTSNVVTLDKQVTSTAPAQYVVEFEVSFYLLDVEEQVILDETSFVVKGVDRLENKAAIQAINSINPRSPQVRKFMNGCRGKVIEYYNTRVPTLVKKAESLAERHDYETALAVLAGIPDIVDQYPMVEDRMTSIYLQYLNRNSEMYMKEAKSSVASNNYEAALRYLNLIDPDAAQNDEAVAMIEAIGLLIDGKEKELYEQELARFEQEREDRLKSEDTEAMLRKAAIEAGLSQSSGSPVTQQVTEWFMMKFGS